MTRIGIESPTLLQTGPNVSAIQREATFIDSCVARLQRTLTRLNDSTFSTAELQSLVRQTLQTLDVPEVRNPKLEHELVALKAVLTSPTFQRWLATGQSIYSQVDLGDLPNFTSAIGFTPDANFSGQVSVATSCSHYSYGPPKGRAIQFSISGDAELSRLQKLLEILDGMDASLLPSIGNSGKARNRMSYEIGRQPNAHPTVEQMRELEQFSTSILKVAGIDPQQISTKLSPEIVTAISVRPEIVGCTSIETAKTAVVHLSEYLSYQNEWIYRPNSRSVYSPAFANITIRPLPSMSEFSERDARYVISFDSRDDHGRRIADLPAISIVGKVSELVLDNAHCVAGLLTERFVNKGDVLLVAKQGIELLGNSKGEADIRISELAQLRVRAEGSSFATLNLTGDAVLQDLVIAARGWRSKLVLHISPSGSGVRLERVKSEAPIIVRAANSESYNRSQKVQVSDCVMSRLTAEGCTISRVNARIGALKVIEPLRPSYSDYRPSLSERIWRLVARRFRAVIVEALE